MPKPLEDRAEAIVAQLFDKRAERRRQAKLAQGEPPDPSWHTVDVASTRMNTARSVEHVSLWALNQLGIPKRLRGLGMSSKTKPASERATYTWLCNESGLGECLGGSFQRISLMHLYRVSDQLIKHRDAIESRVFTKAMSLFGLGVTVALFDLTNTYLAGSGSAQSLAKHGRSKEKRNDRSLITLALVLDGSGFVQCLKIYAGNVAKQETLQKSRKSKIM